MTIYINKKTNYNINDKHGTQKCQNIIGNHIILVLFLEIMASETFLNFFLEYGITFVGILFLFFMGVITFIVHVVIPSISLRSKNKKPKSELDIKS